MTRKLRALMVTVSVGILVYLVSLASVSVAEVGSAAAEERLADVTVSLEACVVRVEIEAVGDGADNADYRALSLAKAERLLSRVGDEGTEVVSGLRLLVGNGKDGVQFEGQTDLVGIRCFDIGACNQTRNPGGTGSKRW